MAGNLGSLVVKLGLDAAEFTRGLTKAEFQAQRFGQNLDKAIAISARTAGLAIGAMATAAVAAFVAIDNLSKGAAAFKDLEEKIGGNAEALASLAVAAAVGGASMETVASASIKLTKALTGVDDESKAAGAALTALGIPIAEFKTLDPTAQFEAVAKALAKFQDGTAKTAVALALFGKSGAEVLPFLKELEASGGRQVILTQKQIELADAYADQQARAIATTKLYAQSLATDALPAINAVIKAAGEFIRELVGVDVAAARLGVGNSIRDFSERAVLLFARVVDAGDGVIRIIQGIDLALIAAFKIRELPVFDLSRFDKMKEIIAGLHKDLDALAMRPLFSTKVQQEIDAARAFDRNRSREDRGFTPPKPALRFSGAEKAVKSGADDLAKAELQGRIKAFENAIREEQDILRARENFLQGYYRDDQLGIREYFSKRQELIVDALANEQSAFDKQIQTLKAFAGDKEAISVLKASTADRAELARIDSFAGKASAKERIDVENKIADVVAKRAKAQQEASFKSTGLSIEETKAVEKFGESLERVTIQLEALRGNQVSAASLGFDEQNKELNKLIKSQLDSTDAELRRSAEVFKEKQSQSKALVVAQAQLSAEQENFGLIIDEIGIKQSRIDLARRTGSITTLEALVQESDANTSRIAKLTAVADAYEKIAIAAGDKRAIAAVDRMRLQIEELAASSDLLAKKFSDIFEGAFADALTNLVTGTKSFKDSIKDMERSIVRSISNIASQNIAESLFGKTGALGGVGGFFASLFGGAKGAVGSAGAVSGAAGAAGATAAADTALAALSKTVTATSASFSTFTDSLGGSFQKLGGFVANLFSGKSAESATAAAGAAAADASLRGLSASAIATSGSFSGVSASTESIVKSIGGFGRLFGETTASAVAAADASLATLSTAASGTTASFSAVASSADGVTQKFGSFVASLVSSKPVETATGAVVEAATDTASNAGAVAADAALLALSTSASATTAAFSALDATLLVVSTGATVLTTAFTSVAAAAASAAAALATVAASSAASAAGSVLGGLAQGGGFAKGGNPPVNKASWVGEEGRELFVPKVAGTIVPNDRLSGIGGVTNNVFHINVPAGTSRASADQIAAATARKVQRAARIL